MDNEFQSASKASKNEEFSTSAPMSSGNVGTHGPCVL